MAKRKPKLVYSIICDDVRQEINNKLSYIGTYGPFDTLVGVSKLPYVFPKFCICLFCKDVQEGDFFSSKLMAPSGKELGKSIEGAIPEGTKPQSGFVAFAVYTPLRLEEEGTHTFSITFNENERLTYMVEFRVELHKK
jgi:hypothetical protein